MMILGRYTEGGNLLFYRPKSRDKSFILLLSGLYKSGQFLKLTFLPIIRSRAMFSKIMLIHQRLFYGRCQRIDLQSE